MRAVGTGTAKLLVKLRLAVIVMWIGGSVVAAVMLPSISEAGNGSLGALVPEHAPAIRAERISAEKFRFPILSRTIVVVRNPRGLSPRRQASIILLAERLSLGHVPGFEQIGGALPVVNTLGAAPFSREHGTTALLYLYFRPGVGSFGRTRIARRLVRQMIGDRAGEYAGVTGEAPARVSRTRIINGNLKWVELATIVLVAAAIGLHFRAPGAALLTLAAIGVAYVFADRLVVQLARLAGLAAPAEIQPVLVVLVFGVVTDYTIFFLSGYRARLAGGEDMRDAVTRVIRQTTPIIAVAGTTVAVGTLALLVAHLNFLQAFGPGLAIAVVIAMIVSVTFVPALLAAGGSAVFWPRRLAPGSAEAAGARGWLRRSSRGRTVRFAARHPVPAALLATALVGGAASGLSSIALGNELIVGLPSTSGAHAAYAQARTGFAAGVLAPVVIVVTGPQIASRRAALARFQRLLARQRDVALALGPAQQPLPKRFGVALSTHGDAARYALVLGTDPLGPNAIADVRQLDGRLPELLKSAGLRNAHALIGGDTALSADSVDDTLSDLQRVGPAVLVAIFVVIALFLRALIAPVYLVLTSAIAVLAALGLTVYVMQMLFGYGQITYYVIFVVTVLLVSLGSDYNVFLVGRIWQEHRRRPLRDAVEVGGAHAARPITTAGLVLAASFALLAIVPVSAFREIAFAMAVGLFIDTFVVRTVLVPALISLVGPVGAWPGRRGWRRSRSRSSACTDESDGARDTTAPPRVRAS